MANIYVGNCSFDVTEEQLRDLFAAYGEVDKINVITDRDTGRSKGFAFVEMADEAGAAAAISQINGREVDGRTIRVEEAKPRRPREDRGGYRRNRY